MRKKNGYIFGCFPVEEMKKKIKCVKNEKKKFFFAQKVQQKLSWATAQLCHDTMENCIVT